MSLTGLFAVFNIKKKVQEMEIDEYLHVRDEVITLIDEEDKRRGVEVGQH